MAPKRTDTDMTKGSPMSIILKFTMTLLMGNIAQQLYNIVDTIIVGRYVNPEALGAVGSTGTIMFLVMGTSNGMVTGFTVVTSQKYGALDSKGVKASVTNGFYLSLAVAAFLTTFSLLIMRPLLTAMNTPDDIFDYAYAYITTICSGIVCSIMYNLCASLMRAIGNSKMPLIFLLCSAATNVCLDLLFIIGFGLETRGAALATVISQGLAVIPCVIYIYTKMPTLRPSKEDWKPDSRTIRQQLRLGIPMAIQYGITASGTVIMQSAFNTFDSVAVTAITTASKFQGIITQGMFTVGQTMSAYIGQNYGARNMKRIRQGVSAAIKIFIVYSVIAAGFAILSLRYLLWIFFDTEVDVSVYIPWAMPYIIECAVCYFFLALIFIYRNTIQSVGYAGVATVLGFVELGARMITSFYSIHVHNYYIAVASDPFAWAMAGIAGVIIASVIFKKISRRWAAEEAAGNAGSNHPGSDVSPASSVSEVSEVSEVNTSNS
ncbi:MATE family efflux transporter [Butyrivibrio sp. AE2032]|uniref:MATE family efflux transporter n=1 Tax=Butyrivibrio sp. AE2032 TaxID=1458463 RepID=UPI00083352E6|nr:MATE family efflux transporter [Butyrivibrio sp. AE2032]